MSLPIPKTIIRKNYNLHLFTNDKCLNFKLDEKDDFPIIHNYYCTMKFGDLHFYL